MQYGCGRFHVKTWNVKPLLGQGFSRENKTI